MHKTNSNLLTNLNPLYPWFGCLHYLTMQSALFMTIALILWFINFYKHFKWMRNNVLIICTITYNTIVFILYNTMLLPENGKNPDLWNYYSFGPVWWWIDNIFVHCIGPLCAILFFAFSFFSIQQVKIESIETKKTVLMGMIYPFIYLTYLVFLFFITHRSVYGNLTAMWNFNDIIDSNSNHISKPGSISQIYVPIVALAVIVGMLFLFNFLNEKFIVKKYIENKQI
jgi:hypothetical protein